MRTQGLQNDALWPVGHQLNRPDLDHLMEWIIKSGMKFMTTKYKFTHLEANNKDFRYEIGR